MQPSVEECGQAVLPRKVDQFLPIGIAETGKRVLVREAWPPPDTFQESGESARHLRRSTAGHPPPTADGFETIRSILSHPKPWPRQGAGTLIPDPRSPIPDP
jgi:hypothetical protein